MVIYLFGFCLVWFVFGMDLFRNGDTYNLNSGDFAAVLIMSLVPGFNILFGLVLLPVPWNTTWSKLVARVFK